MTPSQQRTPARQSGIVIPHQPKWHGRLAARLIWLAVRAFSATIRFRFHDPATKQLHADNFLGEPVIFCIWHNRLALCLELYRYYVQKFRPERRMAAIVSASKDGGLLARVLELFHVQPVRGSSSRRGAQAILEMTSFAQQGLDLAVTPDGPRGPCYQVQEGVAALAQLTGRAVIPVVYSLNWKWQLKSWDRFQIPLPFAVCRMRLGDPMRLPRECSDEQREQFRHELEKRMRALTVD